MKSLKLKIRELDDDIEVEKFLVKFKDNIGVKLSLSYSKQGKVFGAYVDNQLVGGFMVITEPSYRSLMFVPDHVKDEDPILKSNSIRDFVEVNGFWIENRYRATNLSTKIWLSIRKEVLRANKTYLLLMYNAENKGLAKIYANMKPKRIYLGPARVMANQVTHNNIAVCAVHRTDFIFTPLRGIGIIFRRFFLDRRIKRKSAALSKVGVKASSYEVESR